MAEVIIKNTFSFVGATFNPQTENLQRVVRSISQNLSGSDKITCEMLLVVDGYLGLANSFTGISKNFTAPSTLLICHRNNLGLGHSLNVAIQKSRGRYLLRYDDDDKYILNRIKLFNEIYLYNPSIDICGTAAFFGFKRKRLVTYPETHSEIIKSLKTKNPLNHPTVILRRAIFQKYKIKYDATQKYGAEDWDMWLNFSQYDVQFYNVNVPSVIYNYDIQRQYSLKKIWQRFKAELKLSQKYKLKREIRIVITLFRSLIYSGARIFNAR